MFEMYIGIGMIIYDKRARDYSNHSYEFWIFLLKRVTPDKTNESDLWPIPVCKGHVLY